MKQRIITMFAIVLGVFLSATASAQAIQTPTFNANPQPGYYNEPITLTDTSGSSGVHEWDCHYGNHSTFVPEQTGNSAICVYTKDQIPQAAQRVTEGSQQMTFADTLSVIDHADAPFDTILASPTSVSLPQDTILLRTPKTTLDVVCTTAQDLQCPAEVVGRSGPDGSGLYSYSVRIMNAAMGPGTELDVTASNGPGTPVDRDQFALTVTANANDPFGLDRRNFLVCQTGKRGKYEVGASIDYYSSGTLPKVKMTLLRKKDTGGYGKVKTVKGSSDGTAFSRYFLQTTSALVSLSSKALNQGKYKVKATIGAKPYLQPKTKTTTLKVSKCG